MRTVAGVEKQMPPRSDHITLRLSRGDARGLVTHIERTFGRSDKPMRLAWIAEEIAALLGEERPYPEMPTGRVDASERRVVYIPAGTGLIVDDAFESEMP